MIMIDKKKQKEKKEKKSCAAFQSRFTITGWDESSNRKVNGKDTYPDVTTKTTVGRMRVGSLWCNLERKKTNLKTKGEPLQIFLRDDTTKTWKKDPITRQKILVKNSIGMMIRWRKRNYENDYPTIKRRISQHWANQSRTLYDLSFFFSLFFC